MAKQSLADKWLKENGHNWDMPKATLKGELAHKIRRRNPREVKAGAKRGQLPSIKAFVEEVRRLPEQSDCVFVPYAQRDVPAAVVFCGKTISAARYMLLLTQGTPKFDIAYATHKCGNGHLSCVNPQHLEWGDPSTNMSDAVLHRGKETVQDKIDAVS